MRKAFPSLDEIASPRQLQLIKEIGAENDWTNEQIDVDIDRLFGKTLHTITRKQASQLIDHLAGRRPAISPEHSVKE